MSLDDEILTICSECSYPHPGDDCPNPACPANPSLSDGTRAMIEVRRAMAETERQEREFRQRMWELSFKPR